MKLPQFSLRQLLWITPAVAVASPPQAMGRPRIPLCDAIFAAVFKVYSTFSGRRFMSDLRDAHHKGYINRVPSYNALFTVFEDEDTFPVLKQLVVDSAKPLAVIDKTFAVDSTGFTGCRFDKWFDVKYGEKSVRAWVKAHVMTGTLTNVISAVEIHEQHSNDGAQMPALLATTAETFRSTKCRVTSPTRPRRTYRRSSTLASMRHFRLRVAYEPTAETNHDQFSLRDFFWLVALAAILTSWGLDHLRAARRIEQLESERGTVTQTHALIDILFLCVAGTVVGCEGPSDIAEFAREKLAWFRRFVPLKNGVPSHDTIGRVIGLLKPKAAVNKYNSSRNESWGSFGRHSADDGKAYEYRR